MSDLLNMKNNLIQNFYIIGLLPNEIVQRHNSSENIFSETLNDFVAPKLVPKIITKFPPIENNHNSIFDELVIEHCFPNDFQIYKDNPKGTIFSFELDNTIYKYVSNNQYLYSKIHFTCLQFFEKVEDYDSFLRTVSKNSNNNEIKENSKNDYYIPKIICFGSLLPFNIELSNILIIIYEYFINQTFSKCQNSLNLLPIEKIIEQIVMCLPLPISIDNEVNVSFDLIDSLNSMPTSSISINNWKEDVPLSLKVNFPIYHPDYCYLNNLYDNSLVEVFSYFTVEDVVKIFKYIILEVPILFFNKNIGILSSVIEGFLSLLPPFKYVLPYTNVLPNKYYGLINIESKFIFGISGEYNSNFFKDNNILLDKSIIVVTLKTNKKSKVEEIQPKQEELKDYIIIDDKDIFAKNNPEMSLPNGMKIDINNIEFPLKRKKKLISKIRDFLNEKPKRESKHKNIITQPNTKINNSKIRLIFYKFFLKLLEGYTDYFHSINDQFSYGDNIRYKSNSGSDLNSNVNNFSRNYLNPNDFIKEIFNMDEFISKVPKDNHKFYKVFFNTKLFFNFMRQKVYLTNEQDVVNYKIFDLLTFLKKHKDARKNTFYMNLYNDFKNSLNTNESQVKPFSLNISNEYNFVSDEKKIITQGAKTQIALEKYAQLIKNHPFFSIKYFLFPKLLFDNEFFEINYSEQFYMHLLELPSDKYIKIVNGKLQGIEKTYTENVDVLINIPNDTVPSKFIGDSFQNRNSNSRASRGGTYQKLFEILVDDYIEIDWLLLASCSLWYCNNNNELDLRISKIFDILDKIGFIEEQVLSFLYIFIYKYGNKSQFIKMYEYVFKFLGYSTYTNISLLYAKINQKDKESINKSDNKENNSQDNKNNFKSRSFLDFKKILSNENNNNNENNSINIIDTNNNKDNNYNQILKEQITFYTIQKCDKCGQKNEVSIIELIHHRTRKKLKELVYKCSNCKEEKLPVYIRYDIILNNKKENKVIYITSGKFKLIPPHILYQQTKDYIIYLKNIKLDINHIFSNDKINLLNFIFYFSYRNLPFDFLLPYTTDEDEKYFEREYFESEEEENEDEDENEDGKIDVDNIIHNKDKKSDLLIIENRKENNFSILGKNDNK